MSSIEVGLHPVIFQFKSAKYQKYYTIKTKKRETLEHEQKPLQKAAFLCRYSIFSTHQCIIKYFLPCLDDELGNVVNLNPNAALQSTAHQNFRRASRCCIHSGTECGSRSNAGSNPVYARHQDVISAVFSRVMGTTMA